MVSTLPLIFFFYVSWEVKLIVLLINKLCQFEYINYGVCVGDKNNVMFQTAQIEMPLKTDIEIVNNVSSL